MQSPHPFINIHHLSYIIEDRLLFNDLSLSFNRQKIGLVGANGIGKSTLLKLITGEIKALTGSKPENTRAYSPIYRQ